MAFPIDFVRQVIEQTLLEEHLKNPNYFGGENQVNLFSFYEQLQKEEEVDRYTEMYRDLINQQNRTGLIMNGTIIAPENPTITNVYSAYIVPFTFTCSFRVTLANRDLAIDTINNIIDKLKGRVSQVVEFSDGKLFKVGTIGTNDDLNSIKVKNGDYIASNVNLSSINSIVSSRLSGLNDILISQEDTSNTGWYYIGGNDNKLYAVSKPTTAWKIIDSSDNLDYIILPNSNSTIRNKMNLDLSFDSFRCDEPRVLSAEEYCVISFSGSATLSTRNVMLGNQIVKLGVRKDRVKANTDIVVNGDYVFLEPLEIPSSSNAGTQINQLLSNKFMVNSHTNSIAPTIQYTFIMDRDISILKQWYIYARQGFKRNSVTASILQNEVCPNLIYYVREYLVDWDIVETNTFPAKIIESIDIESTESDVMTITIPFQIQGTN